MTNFEPSPWPDEIQDYFSEHSAIAWVPRFLHETIADFTEYISGFCPDFRYQDIQIWHDGSFRIRLENSLENDSPFLETVLDGMSTELANIYRSFATA